MKANLIFNATRSLGKLLVFFCILWAAACSNDDVPPIGDGDLGIGDGIDEEDLETYAGDIGLALEVRSVARKGYQPSTIVITVNASSGDFSQTLDVDPYSAMAQIKLPVDSLSPQAEDELRDGVGVTVEILNPSGSSIWKETFSKISFQSNPRTTTIVANELEDLNTEVHFKTNTPYYIQIVEDGVPVNKAVTFVSLAFTLISHEDVEFNGSETPFLFSFEAIPGTDNTFAIKNLSSNRYVRINRDFRGSSGIVGRKHAGIVNDLEQFPESTNTDAQFVVEKESDGVYRLQSVRGERIKSGPPLVGLSLNHPDATDVTFRFIPLNIDWDVESIETRFLEPILPPAQNGFSYNSILTNCSQGQLSQTIGSSMTEETVTTVGWQESISISSSHSAGVSLTLGVEVEGNFFGNKAKYSAEIMGNYQYTTTSTTENTQWEEASGRTSETFFSERTITVPPQSASLVYDAFQTYNNIRVNVVQRLRVRGTEHDTGEALTGNEISTQFHFNGFTGLVTEIGSDYVEVTLRGVATLDQVFETQSEVQEVPPNCDGAVTVSQ